MARSDTARAAGSQWGEQVASFQVVETFLDGPLAYLSGITDLQGVPAGSGLRLVSATRPGGGLLSFDIGSQIELRGIEAIPVVPALPAPARIEMASIGGAEVLLVTGGDAARIAAYRIDPSGEVGAPSPIEGSPAGALSALELVRLGEATFAITARQGDSALVASRLLADGRMQEVGPWPLGADWPGVDVTDLAQVTVGAETYLLALSVRHGGLLAFRVDSAGGLSPTGALGPAGGLGLAAPSAVEVVRLAGVDYALVAGAGSSSISVVQVGAGGTLGLTDHVIDSLDTRFQGVQSLATVALGDRVFLFAGGGDDGITAFTLLPGGRLLPVGQVAQADGGALVNIGALSAFAEGGRIELFAAGEGAGITRLRFDPGPLAPLHRGGASADLVTGGPEGDLIDGGAGADTLAGGAGADILIDGAGGDRLSGGAGADTFVLVKDGLTDTILDFEPGLDRLDLTAWGRVYAVEALEILSTASGATLRFGAETLILDTADGRPLSAADFTPASLFPLTHVAVDPVVAGLRLPGTPAGDVQTGGLGDDILEGSAGADRMEGGAGFDTADYSAARGSQRVDLLAPSLNTNLAAGDTHLSIEGLIGGAGPDNLRGTMGDNVLRGGGNVDWLYGRRGHDLLDGGVGDDVLLGGLGQDTLAGGANRDRAQYSESLEGLTADLERPQDNTGEAAGDVFDSIEDLAGSRFADRLFGDAGANRLFGRDGDDALFGRNGADTLNGGSGRDTLDGGTGDDALRGGTQADTFIFSGGTDRVEDFRRSDGDRLHLEDAVFGPGWDVPDLIAAYADLTPAGVQFDFGFGNSVTLSGVTSLAALDGLVWIV